MNDRSGSGRLPGLDGLRAVAVTAVMLAHAWGRWLPGGTVGVDVFFALSGFLITGLLLAERAEHGRVDLLRFWGRRALRLLPALALMLAFVCAYFRPPVADVLSVVFYAANWRHVTGGSLGPLDPTWSLAVEEQFYILWPLVLFGLAVRGGALWHRVLVVCAVGCVSALGLRLWLAGDVIRIYDGTDTRMDSLLVGAGLATLVASGRLHVSAGWLRAATSVALLLLGACMFVDLAPHPVAYSGIAVAAVTVVTGIVLDPAGPLTRLLSFRPLVWLGQISYGVYLWHFPLQFVANDLGVPLKLRFPFVFGVTVVIAAASFLLIERPLQRRFRHVVKPAGSVTVRA